MKRSFQPAMALIVLSAAMLQVFVPASAAVIVHNDGGTYDYPPLTAAGDSVEAYNTTTVNVSTGGSIGGYLYAYGNSTVNVSGGSIGKDLQAYGNSKVNVSGGTI